MQASQPGHISSPSLWPSPAAAVPSKDVALGVQEARAADTATSLWTCLSSHCSQCKKIFISRFLLKYLLVLSQKLNFNTLKDVLGNLSKILCEKAAFGHFTGYLLSIDQFSITFTNSVHAPNLGVRRGINKLTFPSWTMNSKAFIYNKIVLFSNYARMLLML